MKYTIKTTYRRAVRISQPYGQTRNYSIEWLDKYRAGSLSSYVRASSLDRLTQTYYQSQTQPRVRYHHALKPPRRNLRISLTRAVKQSSDETRHQHLEDRANLPNLPVISYSKNCKEVDRKSEKMGIRLMELKTDGSHYEFVIRDTFTATIVTWQCLPDIDSVTQYLKKHAFPQDRLYSKKAFLQDVQKATGYIHLIIEKRETAEFICDLCCALI